MKTVHIVFNAHIDPIWLWPWQSGLDEVFSTCRSACDRLDAHSDIVFTRGEAWVYDQIERIDPALFARIRGHVEAGRWEIVGGWWIQPDCNLPSGFGLEQQIGIGKKYFLEKFGQFPRVAYNVDSFGHAATLPGLMHAAGQDRYVMMRPQQHEMELPACLFRWRGYEDGPEVVTFRIPTEYNPSVWLDEARIRKALEHLPEGIDHTMLFVGFGDHGGGPTERQIQSLHERQHRYEGIELVFSSPSRYFDAIWSQRDSLPLITGELQQHAVGCYSVYRPIKTHLRKAEHMVQQAELFLANEGQFCAPDARHNLNEAWKKISFHAFHDTLGGTCLPSAYAQPLAQLGTAQDTADTLLHEGLRRKFVTLPDDPYHRIVLHNASDLPYAGPVEFSPWLDWTEWAPEWRLVDEHDLAIPFQIIADEGLMTESPRLLFSVDIPPGDTQVVRIQYAGETAAVSNPVQANVNGLWVHDDPIIVSHSTLSLGEAIFLSVPKLMLYTDTTDTWSHGIDRYSEDAIAEAVWEPVQLVDQGPLMGSWIRYGTIGESRLTEEWRLLHDGFVEQRLKVDWREQHKLLKLVQPLTGLALHRHDGILGGWLERPFDGRELPVRDGILIECQGLDGLANFGIACPDVFAADATVDRIRWTLLRSAIMAHHNPHSGESPRRTFSDQGEHTFTFRYFGGPAATMQTLDRHASQLQRPLVVGELTRGMPTRLVDQPIHA